MARTVEREPSAKESHFRVWLHELMPPVRTRASGNQANNGRPLLSTFVCLADPLAQLEPVRWIAPDNSRPLLLQCVLFSREVALAFCILRRRCDIEGKTKLSVQLFKQWRWSSPLG
jgi:hypothetical protein